VVSKLFVFLKSGINALKFRNLQDWLSWQETLHPTEIELGLERVQQVLKRLLKQEFAELFAKEEIAQLPFTLITVGGTNGKGSTIAFLEAIALAAGYKTGCYTSPHFLHYNERIRLNDNNIDDDSLCQAFDAINTARGEISISYFEFSTLAAIYYFIQQRCEVVILEVGLGGRLDAVNILDADCSLVTTVDLDHQEWLGEDIETIAFEKAGIYRSRRPAIYGDVHLPISLDDYSEKISARLLHFEEHYQFQERDDDWDWHSEELDCHYTQLPKPNLPGSLQLKNASNAIIALSCLTQQLPRINKQSIINGLKNCRLTGRYQSISTHPEVILDVAHNPQAAARLAEYLAENSCTGKTHVIFSILADKDIARVVAALSPQIDSWHIFELDVARSMAAEKIANIVSSYSNRSSLACYNSFSLAYQSIIENMGKLEKRQDRIIVFGSFFTVACALSHFSE